MVMFQSFNRMRGQEHMPCYVALTSGLVPASTEVPEIRCLQRRTLLWLVCIMDHGVENSLSVDA